MLLRNAPEDYLSRLEGLDYDTTPAKDKYDFILVFVYKQKHIPRYFEEGVKSLRKGGKLWFCYAKKGSDLSTDITRDQGWSAADTHNLVAVRQVAIDKTWSALRFKPSGDVQNMQRQNARREFKAEIMGAGEDSTAYIGIPGDLEQVYGSSGKIAVKATIDEYPFNGYLIKKDQGFILNLPADFLNNTGKGNGSEVNMIIEKDVDLENLQIPHILDKALNENPFCREFYNSLSYSNRKEYANWVGSAKRAETQKKRLDQVIEMLKAGIKNPFRK